MKLLIADTEQLKECVSINQSFDFSAIKPFVMPAQNILIRYIGEELMEDLVKAAYDTEAASDTQNSLIDLARVPIANLALLSYASIRNVQISEMGVSRATTNGLSDAFEWQFEGVRKELASTAYNGIEDLLRYLERNLSEVPSYQASEAYKKNKGLLIRSAILFSEYYQIDSSRLVFQSLLPALRASQSRRLSTVMGDELIDTLLAADLAGTLTAKQAKLLGKAQEALAYLTIARALREKVIQISEQGVTVNGVNTIAYKKPVSEESLQKNIDHFNSEADLVLAEVSLLITPPTSTPLEVASRRVQGDRIVSF